MDGYTITAVSRLTGFPKTLIEYKIWHGLIVLQDGLIKPDTLQRIQLEKEMYISILEFAQNHSTNRFHGDMHKDRYKLIDYLEVNKYFGLQTIDSDAILMSTNKDTIYFLRADVPNLENYLSEFLEFFGFAEIEKIERLLSAKKATHTTTCNLIHEYISACLPEEKKIPPCVTECVRNILTVPDVISLQTEHILTLMQNPMSHNCKEHIIKFLKYARVKKPVQYSEISLPRYQTQSVPAYSDETYIALMRCIFNAQYIDDHDMIAKALNNHIYAETWLFISLCVTCGWRAKDICRGWQYPRLLEHEEGFLSIKKETLYDDILYDRITDDVYEDVCKYSLAAVIAAEQLPTKTSLHNPTTLRNIITPELYIFFGLLTLIAEAVMLKTGDGYMQPHRTDTYQNKVTLRSFFGEEIMLPLCGNNIQSRRLNKTFLQGVEKCSRLNGNGGLLSSAIASYARNHTSLDTITHYLKDHNLNGETAEMVLYYMLQRGVFGFIYYRSLLVAYPDIFQKLPLADQNRLIEVMQESPLQIELCQAGILAQAHVQNQFQQGNSEEVIQILENMLAITQTMGKGKDDGIYCIRRAQGNACCHPEYASCLANGCQYIVFTRLGYIPLIKLLKEYMDAAKYNKKAASILKQVIMPRYQDIINTLMRETRMSKQDRIGMKQIMEDILFG